MKKIKLTKNKWAIVDNQYFDYLNQFNWQYDGFYAGRFIRINKKKTRIRMHQEIVGTKKGMVTDHIDGNRLNNRKYNLRICTQSENQKNMKKFITNKSGFVGVYFDKTRKKWAAQKCFNGKRKTIGRFLTAKSAYVAYKRFIKSLQ